MTNDNDEFVYVPPPDPRLQRAERYAQAVSAAAAANERLLALEGHLAVSEHYREQLEMELSGVQWNSGLGQVFTRDGDEPDHDLIMDLRDGSVWRRDQVAAEVDERWKRWDGSGTNYYSGWPIEDHGPFIAFEETWGLNRILEELSRKAYAEDKLHTKMRDLTGYKDPEAKSQWTRPELPEAFGRIMTAQAQMRSEADLQKVAAQRASLAAQEELNKKLVEIQDRRMKESKGYGPVLDAIVAALPPVTPDGLEKPVHELVKQAELAILQDCEVPIEGDPEYAIASLMTAAAHLVLAATEIAVKSGEIPEPPVPEPTELPF